MGCNVSDLYEVNLNEIPPGYETGLIDTTPESFAACCSHLDASQIVTDRTVWKKHIKSDGLAAVDLGQFVKIKSQTGPSCTSNAATGAYETICRYAGYDVPILSAASVFGFVGSRNGSSVQANFKRMQEVGCVPESMWPSRDIWSNRKPAGFDAEAAKYRLAEADWVPDFNTGTWMLLCGRPILFGVQWGSGGHAILGVQVVYRDGKWGWRFANSWSTSYGDKGFGILWESQIASGIKTRYGAAAFRAPTHLPTR
jgi:hypothetical protein